MTTIPSFIVALAGLGIPAMLACIAAWEAVTGKEFDADASPAGSFADQEPLVQALIILLVVSNLFLAAVGAHAVVTAALGG